MTDSIPTLIGDRVLKEETDDARAQAAADFIAYGLAALMTLEGPQVAAEIAYRCADKVAAMRMATIR